MSMATLSNWARRRLNGMSPLFAHYQVGDIIGDVQERVTTIEDSGGTGADPRIGTMSNLTTTEKASVVGAINEVDGHADDAIGDIGTLASLTTEVQTDLVAAVNEVDGHADDAIGDIGTLGNLTTSVQTDLVSAINEVDGHADDALGDIGTLASLTTTEQGSLVGAINEVDGNADAAYVLPVDGVPSTDMTTAVQNSLGAADSAYQKPVDGIPDTDLTAGVQASLGLADTAIHGSAAVTDIRMGRKQLRGTAKTYIGFQADTAATLTSTVQGPFDCSGVGSGGTILINPDGDGEDTATLEATAATSQSGATPSQDISAGADNKFMISVDGDEAEEVELTLVNCDTGANIATEMETQIQALAGNKTGVTVTWNAGASGKYLITSAKLGTDSAVVVTPAALNNVTEELKIGDAGGGTETGGTGDCADINAVTCDELVTLVNGDIALVTASNDDEYLVITSNSEGRGSSLVMGDSTLKTVVGLAQAAADYGLQGLGYDTDMEDANYLVWLTVDGTAGGSLADIAVGANTRATDSFEVECETAADESYVNILVIGVAASA